MNEASELTPPTETKRNLLRRLYDWVLSWAETPYGTPALFVLAVAEASFFPLPPDLLLIALALALPGRAYRYALWCLLASVIGGVLGYMLGWGMWSAVEPLIIPRIFSAEKFDSVMQYYRDWDALAVFVAGFSPVPYKVFTIAAGVAKLNLAAFIGASVVGRGARFLLVAFLIRRYGERARYLIDRYFNLLTLLVVVLLVGGFVVAKYAL